MYAIGYHVTQKFFRKFDLSFSNPQAYFGSGIYLSSDVNDCQHHYHRDSSEVYQRLELIAENTSSTLAKVRKRYFGKNDYLLTCALTIKNPFMALEESGMEITKDIYNVLTNYDICGFEPGEYVKSKSFIQAINSHSYNTGEFNSSEILMEMGFDGAIQSPTYYFPYMYSDFSSDTRHYVLFNTKNIMITRREKI